MIWWLRRWLRRRNGSDAATAGAQACAALARNESRLRTERTGRQASEELAQQVREHNAANRYDDMLRQVFGGG